MSRPDHREKLTTIDVLLRAGALVTGLTVAWGTILWGIM